jgi:hypothetical protein
MAIETEPNDDSSRADGVGWSESMQADTSGTDVDWFQFSMYERGWIELQFSGLEPAGGWASNRLVMAAFRYEDIASGTPMWTGYVSADGPTSTGGLFPPGTAYLRFSNESPTAARADSGYAFTAEPHWYPERDAALAIQATDARRYEGDEGASPFTFTIYRYYESSGTASVQWQAEPGSGGSDASDFVGGVFPSGSVTFASGETSRVVEVAVAGDREFEPDEGFGVRLSGAVGATLETSWASGRILSDDVLVAGTAMNDTLTGSDGFADMLLGEGGNDRLAGLGGRDVLDGGPGLDTAVFSGDFAEYAWEYVATADDRALTVARVGEASDTDVLRRVERLEFADRTVDVEDLVLGRDTVRLFFNERTGQTIFTADAAEAEAWARDVQVSALALQVSAPLADDAAAVPVYRVYAETFDLYLWTASEALRDSLLQIGGIGIEDQGVAFHAYPGAGLGGATAIHMLWDWNPSASHPGSITPLNVLYAPEPELPWLLDRPGVPPVADMGAQFWL